MSLASVSERRPLSGEADDSSARGKSRGARSWHGRGYFLSPGPSQTVAAASPHLLVLVSRSHPYSILIMVSYAQNHPTIMSIILDLVDILAERRSRSTSKSCAMVRQKDLLGNESPSSFHWRIHVSCCHFTTSSTSRPFERYDSRATTRHPLPLLRFILHLIHSAQGLNTCPLRPKPTLNIPHLSHRSRSPF